MYNKAKRIISVIMVVFILSSYFSIASFSLEKEFDINNITIDDLNNMSVNELRYALAEYERVYDPYNTYNTNPLMELNQKPTAKPYWVSGDVDYNGNIKKTGSHEVITMMAVSALLVDIGYAEGNTGSTVAAAFSIGLASILPDKDLTLFTGHFYDPDTNKNYLGVGATAKDNLIKYYNKAVSEYNSNGRTDKFYEYVGRAVHYIEDACEPHHAANITAVQYSGVHTTFENYVDGYMDKLLDHPRSHPYDKYVYMHNKSLDQLIYEPAKEAKSLIHTVLDETDKSQWNSTMRTTVFNAIDYTAFVLFKMGVESNQIVPLV